MISKFLMVMILKIASLVLVGKIDNWILGRADFRFRSPRGIWGPLSINCGLSVCPQSRTDAVDDNCTKKIYISGSLWEYFGSSWTTIPGWSNSKVDWTDSVAFRWTWEHWWQIWEDIGGLVTTTGAPGNADAKPGSTSNCWGEVGEKPRLLWEHCRCDSKLMLLLIIKGILDIGKSANRL